MSDEEDFWRKKKIEGQWYAFPRDEIRPVEEGRMPSFEYVIEVPHRNFPITQVGAKPITDKGELSEITKKYLSKKRPVAR